MFSVTQWQRIQIYVKIYDQMLESIRDLGEMWVNYNLLTVTISTEKEKKHKEFLCLLIVFCGICKHFLLKATKFLIVKKSTYGLNSACNLNKYVQKIGTYFKKKIFKVLNKENF